jgi:hypothetical protein
MVVVEEVVLVEKDEPVATRASSPTLAARLRANG